MSLSRNKWPAQINDPKRPLLQKRRLFLLIITGYSRKQDFLQDFKQKRTRRYSILKKVLALYNEYSYDDIDRLTRADYLKGLTTEYEANPVINIVSRTSESRKLR
jgi:hypothetical protein